VVIFSLCRSKFEARNGILLSQRDKKPRDFPKYLKKGIPRIVFRERENKFIISLLRIFPISDIFGNNCTESA